MIAIFLLLLQPVSAEETVEHPCDWLHKGVGGNKTAPETVAACDNQTFQIINHELAKDVNYVYCKPMSNATNYSKRLEGADPQSFKPIGSLYRGRYQHDGYYKDRKCVYNPCQILARAKPRDSIQQIRQLEKKFGFKNRCN